MGTDIHGVLEARSWADDELWLPVVNAGLILRRNYETFARLFGVRNVHGVNPVAANRGFPEHFSDPDVMAWFKARKTPYLDGDLCCHSPSWLTWAEMQAIDWQSYDEDWQMIFNFAKLASEFSDFSDVRLVVWFDS